MNNDKEVIKYLWGLLDDIDTISDIAKGNESMYRRMVEYTQKKRWDTGIKTDGLELDFSEMRVPEKLD